MTKSQTEGKGIKDFSGHNYYENYYDKKKELSNCCNAGVTINSGGEGTRYYVCDECGNPCDLKSWHEPVEDKLKEKHSTGKTKELDWEIRYDEIQKEWEKHRTMNTCSICDSPKGHTTIKDFIKQTLTQQRTELLEEINKLLIGELVIVKTKEPYYYQNKQSIPKEQYEFLLEQRQKLFNLLNKKDETN